MNTDIKVLKPNCVELNQGVDVFVEDYERGSQLFHTSRVVAIFGGSAILSGSDACDAARTLACELSQNDCTIITGGGPGIMRAGNEGASSSSTNTYGLRVESIRDENMIDASYIPEGHLLTYKTLSVRLLTLISSSDAIVFFPGGFGTFEEMFSLLVRLRVGMMKHIPIYFYDSKFWGGLTDWLSTVVLKSGTINKQDLELFRIEDDIKSISAEILKYMSSI